jgi:hypothetical protein
MTTVNAASFSIRVTDIPTVLKAFYGSGRTPYFRSQPGVGKTDLVHIAAQEISEWMVSIGDKFTEVAVVEQHLASMSEVDIRGYLIPENGEASFTKPPFAAAVDRCPRGILFLDEFPQATPEMQKAVAPLLLDRRIGDYQLPPGWMVVCAGNRTADNAGANDMLSHVINRMCMVDVMPPDADDWIEWGAAKGIVPELLALAKIRPQVIFSAPDLSVADTPYCTPRSVHALSDVANRWPGGLRDMVKETAGRAVITGFVGQGAAAEIYGVVTMAINLPQYEDIVKDPSKVMVPKKPDEAYACLMMTAMRAQRNDGAAVVEYITRFDANFAVVGLAALLQRDTEFSKEKGVGDWVRNNKPMVAKLSRHIKVRK